MAPSRAMSSEVIEAIEVEPLFVPLREPFVIASARIDATRAALVRVRMREGDRVAVGLGEAAPLPPVTAEDFPDIDASLRALDPRTLRLDALGPVARAGLETAILDARARLAGVPLDVMLGGVIDPAHRRMVTDVTLPIADPDRMIELALEWRRKGFDRFKVKIGKSLDDDLRALLGVHEAVPDALFRLDANEGFRADQALGLLSLIEARGLRIECFEQPCKRGDLEGMAEVTRGTRVPVVADESVRSMADLERVIATRAARAVNLKLVKLGGPRAALEIGRRARAAGLGLMCGAMVETRLGLTAMAHVVSALGGVDFVDLDTAFLLTSDPFVGGFTASGPMLEIADAPGLGIEKL